MYNIGFSNTFTHSCFVGSLDMSQVIQPYLRVVANWKEANGLFQEMVFKQTNE